MRRSTRAESARDVGGCAMASVTWTVTSASQLAADIIQLDNANEPVTLSLQNNITLSANYGADLPVLNSGFDDTIIGNGYTLDGAGKYQGLFVFGGNVTVQN